MFSHSLAWACNGRCSVSIQLPTEFPPQKHEKGFFLGPFFLKKRPFFLKNSHVCFFLQKGAHLKKYGGQQFLKKNQTFSNLRWVYLEAVFLKERANFLKSSQILSQKFSKMLGSAEGRPSEKRCWPNNSQKFSNF